MSKVFLVDSNNCYSWNRFVDDIRNKYHYSQCFKSDDLYDYFLNLVFALINNKPIILIDRDISPIEADALGVGEINTSEIVENCTMIADIQELIRKVYESTSSITMFTSGTTGQPKKIAHIPSSFTRSVRRSDMSNDAVWGFAYNPTHMAGLQVFFQALLNGATLVNIFTLSAKELLDLIEKYKITHISATPTFYRLLIPCDRTFPSVKRITFGGEKSSEKLHKQIQELFPSAKINNIYASTEAGALFSGRGNVFTIPKDILHLVKIVDNELLLHQTLLGSNEALNLEHQYYHTGDIIRWIDQSKGEFEFESRKNELINVGGYKVNPHEIEEQIMNFEAVANCVVYAKSNSVIGNIVCCDVELIKGATLSELEIKELLGQTLQPFKIPRIIKFVDKLATTKTGKIIRK